MGLRRRLTSTQERLSANIDRRYREDIIKLANGMHLAGHLVPLEQVAIIPSFYTLPDPYNPEEAHDAASDFGPLNFVPVTPDWPQLLTAYAIHGIAFSDMLRGAPRVAILGAPGSGRTIALSLMVILAARQTQVDQEGGLFEVPRIPIYADLQNLNLTVDRLGEEGADPLKPLIDAALVHLNFLGGRALNAFERQFALGQGVIMLDGWDDLSPVDRRQALSWINQFDATYPGNFIVVTGPVNGYGPLQDAGFAPTFIRPWNRHDISELARLWASAWPGMASVQQAVKEEPGPDLIRRAVSHTATLDPFDITLKVWATYAGDDPLTGRRGWYDAYLKRVSPVADYNVALERIGLDLIGTENKTVPGETFTAMVEQVRSGLPQKPSTNVPDYIWAISKQTYVLSERDSRRIGFTYQKIRAYLAALGLRTASMRESLLEDSLDNRLTLSFLAEMADVSEYVQRRMDATPTLSGDHLLQMAAWSAFAPANTPWTATVLKQLSEMFLSEAQFPLLRDRAAAALIASRDSRVPRVFETGMVNSVQSVRLLSTLGLGVLRDPESVPLLGKALEDEDAAVKVAATLALGAMADQPSLDYLLQNLLTGSEMSRRAVAEMLATNYGDHGIELLKEALEDEEDSSTRKAAIYGLERLGPQPWVLEILEKLERRDPELLVRTVAGTLLDRYRRNEVSGPTPPSPPHRTKWIVTWLTEKQTQPASGPDGIDQVIRILSEGGPAEQLGAVELLGALGVADAISPLYDALRNSHEEIRDSAYRALNATGRTLGIQLPGLI